VLFGRAAEVHALTAVLSAPSAGGSAALVVRGEPGVGKTALVAHALRLVMAETPDVTVLATTATPTESGLAFGGLLGVLRPVLDGLAALPARQAAALRSAFALGPATDPDRFAVAAATLGLLAVAAQRCPLIVFIDDWHWIDPASAQALAFAARRLGDDAVAFVATVRAGEPVAVPLDGLDTLDLVGLDNAGAAEMAGGAGVEIEPGVLAELVARTSGNPLALRESIAQLGPLVRRGLHPLPEHLPVSDGVAAALLQRVRALPESVSFALTVAAFESEGSRSVIDAAVGGDPSAAWRTAEEAGLIEVGLLSLQFSHPLVRDALVSSTTPDLRRRIHRSLAVALEANGHQHEATVHLGESAEGPDDEIADRLEALSAEAAHRGDHGAAATLAWRAGALRADRDHRARIWLRAGTEAASAGLAFAATLEAALGETDDASLMAEIQVTRAQLATVAGDPEFAAKLLQSDGEAIIAASPSRGAVLTALAGSCAWMRADGAAARDLAEQAIALVGGRVTPEMAPIANFLIRAGAATGYNDPALAVSTAEMIRERGQTNLAASALFCLLVADQMAEADAFHRWAIAAARDAGSIADVVLLHGPAILLLCRQGHLDAAYAAGCEAIDLAPFVLGPFPLAHAHSSLALVAAVRGDRARCDEHVAEALRLATTADFRIGWLAARHAGALALLGDRLTDAALTELKLLAAELERHDICGATIFPTMPELAETLARTGRTDEARETRDTWRRRVGVDLSTLKAATLARIDALCAESIDESDDHFAIALALFSEMPYPFELARTQLYRGERLRRAGRRRDAAKALYDARAGFETLGARAWCAQSDIELRALGLRPTATMSGGHLPGEPLSPQEYQVAMAASRGASTRDIAASLFISPKTVEAHLTRIYRKLGVSSKAQLVAVVGTTGSPLSERPPA